MIRSSEYLEDGANLNLRLVYPSRFLVYMKHLLFYKLVLITRQSHGITSSCFIFIMCPVWIFYHFYGLNPSATNNSVC